MNHMTCSKTLQACQTPGMCAPHGGCTLKVTPSPVDVPSEPAELLASRMIQAWADAHGRPVPWVKAVEITSIITKMPAKEKAVLMALDDSNTDAQYPISHGTHVIQYSEETFVWYDEAGLQGGVAYSLDSANLALARYAEKLNRPAPAKNIRPGHIQLPDFLHLSDDMRAAGDHAVSRAREDGCASVKVLDAVFFEAAIQRWLNDQQEIIDAAVKDTRPAGCCCPPPGHTGIWAGAMCPLHQGLRRQVL